MKDSFKNSVLFDLKEFPYKDLLNKFDYPWEIVANLEVIVKEVLKDKNIIVGEGSEIDASMRNKGKVIIGKNSTVSDGVLFRGNCIIGDNVHIGHGVEVKNSVIMNNSAVAHLNYIGDSVIGNNVNVGGGLIIANWRFDKKNIKIKTDNGIDTKLEKFGAAVGDNSNLGVNAVLNPGVVLGKNCVVFPLTSVVGTHSESSVVK